MPNLCFRDGQTVLFIGDSITDCGRRGAAAPFGDGYVSLCIDLITSKYPERKIRFINKGIGGNTVLDMYERWEDDVIRHKPDWVSVKIGINDLHRWLRGAEQAFTPENFRKLYDDILDRTAKKVGSKLVLIEPFYISVSKGDQTFRGKVLDLIPQYIEVVREMSKKYKTRIVHTHEMFQRQLKYRDAEVFCPEPVHPNRTGHLLIACELLRVLED